MSKTLLALNNITVTFKTRRGSFKAIEDLNLQLKEGEILEPSKLIFVTKLSEVLFIK